MDHSALREVSLSFLPLAGLHHLAFFTLIIILWMRRRAAERAFAFYFTTAFATASYALLSHPGTRVWGAISMVLAGMWLVEAFRPLGSYSFACSPRPRLVVMGALATFAIAYPGHSGTLPSFVFSPLGVTLPPTLIAATALLNAASPGVSRPLHWVLAVAGTAVGITGLVVEGWINVPLVIASTYALPLLLGRGRRHEAPESAGASSLGHIRDRMYARRTLLPGPSDPRRHRRSGRIRRR